MSKFKYLVSFIDCMKCDSHNKTVVGSCQWCGKQMCRMCVGKRLGAKLFCIECGKNLKPIIERRQLDMMREQQAKSERDREYDTLFG
jgi:hypothetical protein